MSLALPTLRRTSGLILFLMIGALVVHRWNQFQNLEGLVAVQREPTGVMGTRSRIVAVLERADNARNAQILDAAELTLRRQEALFSIWIEASEMSQLNAAKAGEYVRLSPHVVDLLSKARLLHTETAGAFDAAAGPLIRRWHLAVETNSVPSREELELARLESNWSDFSISAASIVKKQATARLDVDGIAKGYAIDRAVDALSRSGAVGGMVEVGGDLRVFGFPPEGSAWQVGIRDPFEPGVVGLIEIREGSVCTSGGYARPIVVAGSEYSHIIDPRNGLPVTGTASVTVIASETATADAWATALSILGADGLKLLPPGSGIEALVISGVAGDASAVATTGFPKVEEATGLRIERR